MKIELKKFTLRDYIRFIILKLNRDYSNEFSESLFEYLFDKIKRLFMKQKDYITSIFVNGKFAGSVGLYAIKNKKSEVGYFVLREFRSKGVATKATQKILNFGFKKLELNKITAITDKKNIASQKVLKRLGFEIIKENKKEKEYIWERLK